jgi:hypothetical protein
MEMQNHKLLIENFLDPQKDLFKYSGSQAIQKLGYPKREKPRRIDHRLDTNYFTINIFISPDLIQFYALAPHSWL